MLDDYARKHLFTFVGDGGIVEDIVLNTSFSLAVCRCPSADQRPF